MENLAPAGDRASLERAVAAGADAVYLGYAAFSARAGAGNFDEQALRSAIRFAHLHHVRVHVTVNTLVKDGELNDVLRVLALLRDAGAYAVLVQDLGVLRLCRAYFPDLTVHASTQMAIHHASGVRWCGRMGIRRVVLARECSLSEIEACCREEPEVEVFGHGAQCVGVSGLCLFSSMLGVRSGNRGRCAQPCRLQYTYRGKRGAWLSPRDVCLRDDLPALERAGVASVKLEGRLKRPEYVAVVAESYRRGLDTKTPAAPEEKQALLQIFQRGGMMRGYAMGCEDAGVICTDRVNHGGVFLGTVQSVRGDLARVRVSLDLGNGDGLQLRTAKGDSELIYAGPDIPAGGTALLRLRPDIRTEAGDEVYRLTSEEQLKRAAGIRIPAIPVDMKLLAMPALPVTLTVTDGETSVSLSGQEVQKADRRAVTAEEMTRCLIKTGGTPFEARDVSVETENAFLPVSALNALRREALDRMEEARAAAFGPKRETESEAIPEIAPAVMPREMPWAFLPDGVKPEMQLLRPGMKSNEETAWTAYYPEDWREPALRQLLESWPAGAWLQLPAVCEEATLNMIRDLCAEYRQVLGGVVLGSVGQLGLDWPVPYGAGQDVPVMNRLAAETLLNEGCLFVCVSRELTGRETENLARGLPVLIPAFGRTRLMLLHHCPARTWLGLHSGHRSCFLCDRNDENALKGTSLRDRMGVEFPLRRLRLPEGCLVELMNAAVTDLTEETKDVPRLLDRTAPGIPGDGTPVTRGHWARPVE